MATLRSPTGKGSLRPGLLLLCVSALAACSEEHTAPHRDAGDADLGSDSDSGVDDDGDSAAEDVGDPSTDGDSGRDASSSTPRMDGGAAEPDAASTAIDGAAGSD